MPDGGTRRLPVGVEPGLEPCVAAQNVSGEGLDQLCSFEPGLRGRSVQCILKTGSEFEKELRSAPVFFPVIPCQRTFALQCPPERALRFQ